MMKHSKHRYEVHTYTLLQGWINCWTITESDDDVYPDSYETIGLAQAEIDTLIAEVQTEIEDGSRLPNDREEFRIYDTMDKVYVD